MDLFLIYLAPLQVYVHILSTLSMLTKIADDLKNVKQEMNYELVFQFNHRTKFDRNRAKSHTHQTFGSHLTYALFWGVGQSFGHGSKDNSVVKVIFGLTQNYVDQTKTFVFRNIFEMIIICGLFGKFFDLKNHEKFPTVQNYSKIHENFPLCNDVIDVTCEVYTFRST